MYSNVILLASSPLREAAPVGLDGTTFSTLAMCMTFICHARTRSPTRNLCGGGVKSATRASCVAADFARSNGDFPVGYHNDADTQRCNYQHKCKDLSCVETAPNYRRLQAASSRWGPRASVHIHIMPLPAKFFKYGSAPISRKQMMVLMWPIGCNGIINIQQQECQQNRYNTPRGVGAVRFDRTFRKKNEEKPLSCMPTAALFTRSGSLYPHRVRLRATSNVRIGSVHPRL